MLKGECELIFRNIETGKTRKLKQSNLVTNGFYFAFQNLDGNNLRLGFNGYTNSSNIQLGISQRTTAPDINQYALADMGTNWRASATFLAEYTLGPVTNTPYTLEDPIIRYTSTFTAPGVGNARTFDTVFIYQTGSGISGVSDHVPAYLLLNSQCTQGDLEILTLIYRLQPTDQASGNPGFNILSYWNKAFFRGIWSGASGVTFAEQELYLPNGMPVPDTTNYPYNFAATIDPNTELSIPGSRMFSPTGTGLTRSATYFRYRYSESWSTSNYIGLVARSITAGNLGLSWSFGLLWVSFSFATNGPRQGLFGHNSSSTTVYLDSVNLPSGTGTLTFNDGWNNPHPECWQIEITGTGNVGVSTYKFKRRKTYYLLNNFDGYMSPQPYITMGARTIVGGHGTDAFSTCIIQRYNNTQVVLWDTNGVTLLNWTNGEYQNWDSTTTPALAATNIGQVASNARVEGLTTTDYIDGTRIYVGCRNTGLYEIDPVLNTVTLISGDPCYGVDVGYQDKVWAMFNDRLVNSDDYTITGNFVWNDATLTLDRTNCSWFICDRYNADSRLCLVRADQNAAQWWDTANTTPATGPSISHLIRDQPYLTLGCDSTSQWFYKTYSLSQGGSTAIFALTYGSNSSGSVITNTNSLHFLSLMGQGVLTSTCEIRNGANGVLKNFTSPPALDFGVRSGFLDLAPGLTLFFHRGNNAPLIFTLGGTQTDTLIWENYGWDGAAWVLDNPNSKNTHATADALIDGVTLQFTNGASGDAFVVDERYTQGFAFGLWKDNATEATFFYDAYHKPYYQNQSLNGLVVPGAPPYEVLWPDTGANFVKAIADTPEFFSINVAATPMTIITAGVPVPGEVLIADDKMTFNVAQASGAITGSYAFLNDV